MKQAKPMDNDDDDDDDEWIQQETTQWTARTANLQRFLRQT